MNSDLQDRILTRLIDSSDADRPWALVVLAALEGEATLAGYLDGDTHVAPPTRPDTSDTAKRVEPPGVYLSSITVSGFRGIGPAVSLPLRPGPGLTLVVGRNGSGKSSFAEALEFLLTDRNYRWEKRAKAWMDGWRNLHDADTCVVRAELVVEGKGPLVVSRTWSGPAVSDGETIVSAQGEKARPFASLGWKDALDTFRPFLSYNELGSLLEDGPSKLYDALSSVLGLDDLVAVQNVLASARKQRQQQIDDAKDGVKALAAQIAAVPATGDVRVDAAAAALRGNDWDLETLAGLAAGEGLPDDSGVGLLQQMANLGCPDVDLVLRTVQELRDAEAACAAIEGSRAGRARHRADLLSAALRYHESHGGSDCPVCSTSNVLSTEWLEATRQEIAALEREAAGFQDARSRRRAAVQQAQRLLSPVPSVLTQAHELGLSGLAEALRLWNEWARGRDITPAGALAAHLEEHVLGLAEALATVAAEARAEVQRREDLWRPVAVAIAEWLPVARRAARARSGLADVRQAEAWWKSMSDVERNERFEPIATRAMTTWEALRLQSNVNLDAVVLEGTGQRRKVGLRVTVDGTPAEAVGVMSQGELHALALSLFLPRATLPESPFRFIAIDDPVQSMDPSRVDGLARVLADAAKARQVLVFTHDDRLPEAVRRLGLPATVLGVTRRDRSVVEVHESADPVLGYLDDARAVAKSGELPPDVVTRVVPGFCRAAIEAACMETVRRRRLRRGEPHESIEQLLAESARTHPLMALALFDDGQRAAEVFAALNKRCGPWAADVFRACKEGAHEAYGGDIASLIGQTRRLTDSVRALA